MCIFKIVYAEYVLFGKPEEKSENKMKRNEDFS